MGEYQTLIAFGGLIFSGVVYAAIAALTESLPDNRGARILMAFGCALVAGLVLLFIYGGLIYLGAAGSGLFDVRISNAAFLSALFEKLFKSFGAPVFAFAAVLASLAAAVGLTVGVSCFFSRATKGRLPYKAIVIIICFVGLLISTLRINAITRCAVQVLIFLLPAASILVFLNVFRCPIIVNRGTFLGAVYSALAVSFLDMLPVLGIKGGIGAYMTSAIDALPFSVPGFTWVAPAMACGVFGTLCYGFFKAKKKS